MPKRKGNITLRDIAALAKVSPTTVSMVLNGKAQENHIPDSTCEKIMQIVREKDFVPNIHARAISRGKSDLIGVVLRDDIGHSFWAEILSGIEKVLAATERHFILSFFDNKKGSETKAFNFLKQKGVDAYIWTPVEESDFNAVRTLAGNKPLLILAGYKEGFSSVEVDENRGGQLAAEYFISQGFRKAAAIGADNQMQSRIAAFREKFTASGGECEIFLSAAEFMEHVREYPAVFCFSDNLALHLYQQCGKAGIRIPQDLSVIGYDNQFFTSLMTPPLTTVNQPKISFGKSAGTLLVDMLDNAQEKLPVRQLLAPDLVVRESCITK